MFSEVTWVSDYPTDGDSLIRVWGAILLDNPNHIREMAWQIRVFESLRDTLAAFDFSHTTGGKIRAAIAVVKGQTGYLSPVYFRGSPDTIWPGLTGPIAWGGHVLSQSIRTLETDTSNTLRPGMSWYCWCDPDTENQTNFYRDSLPAHAWPRQPLMVPHEPTK